MTPTRSKLVEIAVDRRDVDVWGTGLYREGEIFCRGVGRRVEQRLEELTAGSRHSPASCAQEREDFLDRVSCRRQRGRPVHLH